MSTLHFKTVGQALVFMALNKGIDIPEESRMALITLLNEYVDERDKEEQKRIDEELKYLKERLDEIWWESIKGKI